MTWESVKLKDCCISIADGDHQPPPKADIGVPFVTISDIDAFNSLDFEKAMHVPREYYDGLDSKRKAAAGDVLFSVVGSFGIPVLIKDNTPFAFQRHIAILRPDKDLLDTRFLYYSMLSKEFFQRADAVAIGSAQRTVSLTALRNLEITLPPLSVQRRIADILSAYDDLIENNRKQIKLLEEAAQRLYKEWFIDLRFPGHEHTPIINGVPEGWRVGPAKNYFRITIGKTPPRTEHQCFTHREGMGIPWVSISDMGAPGYYMFSTAEGLTQEAVEKYNVKVIPAGTILLSFKLTLGRVMIASESCCTNEAIAHFHVSDQALSEYTYLYLKNFKYDTLGSTSSISRAVNSSIVKDMAFIMPLPQVCSEFSKCLRPFFQKLHVLQKSTLLAQSLREQLLPKLMKQELEDVL